MFLESSHILCHKDEICTACLFLTLGLLSKKITRYNQMIVAIVDVLTSFDAVTNDNR